MTQEEKASAIEQSRNNLFATIAEIDKLLETDGDPNRIADLKKLKLQLIAAADKLPPDLPGISE